jgi:hypothetical protein
MFLEINNFIVDYFFIWNHLWPKNSFLNFQILKFIFLKKYQITSDGENNQKSCCTQRNLQYCSFWLFYLKLFGDQKLCFKCIVFFRKIKWPWTKKWPTLQTLGLKWSKTFEFEYFHLNLFRISNNITIFVEMNIKRLYHLVTSDS